MFITRKFAIMVLLLLSVGSVVWSQVLPTTPPVYVSGGPTIYTFTNGTLTPIFTSANRNFESLAIGPDNVDVDGNGNAKYAYFLYACDPAGTIIRIAFLPAATQNTPPTVAPGMPDMVYSGSVAGLAPVCGRSSSAGDFYITNKAGSGVFVFTGTANVGFGSLSASSPTVVTFSKLPKNMTGRGITQKYVGDLLFVDNFDNQVLRSPYAGLPTPFVGLSSPSPFINSNLNGPVGIAAAVTTTLNAATGVYAPNSMFFVANSNSNTSKILPAQPPVSVFTFSDATQTGVPAASCPGLTLPQGGGPPQVADYLASSPTANGDNSAINNTIYLVTNSNNSGSVWTWNTALAQAVPANCVLTQLASIGTPLSGVAVAPAPVTLNLQANATAANPTPTTFNFNSSIFQLTANGCKASVTAYPLSLATVNSMINNAQFIGNPDGDTNAVNNQYPMLLFPPRLVNAAIPLANLGDGGFETGYVAHWTPGSDGNNCSTVFPDSGFVTGIFNFVDSGQYTNPRAVQCDNSDPTTEPQLSARATTTCGSPQPLGVYPLGGPIAGDLGTKSNSVFAMVNESLGAAELGQFCGFQNPLTGDGTHLPSPPPSFSRGTNTVNVKFKLSTPAGNCKKDFITNAVALISVARIFDANGAPAFNSINVQATASSLDLPPLFNAGNQQYSFTLNLPSIFAQGGAGTYSLTVTFISSNAVDQNTLFTLTQ